MKIAIDHALHKEKISAMSLSSMYCAANNISIHLITQPHSTDSQHSHTHLNNINMRVLQKVHRKVELEGKFILVQNILKPMHMFFRVYAFGASVVVLQGSHHLQCRHAV